MPILPIRNSNAYFGFGKQTVQGTAVAPTLFPRWLDGSNIDIAMKTEMIREGDGTRRLAQVIKNQQHAKIKLRCYPRPIELGFLENATMGLSADVPTAVAAPPATTTTTTITANVSTTVTIASGAGYFGPGGGTYQILIGAGAPGETPEVVTFSFPTTPGTTLTVAAGYNAGKFKFGHTIGAPVSSITAINTSLTTATTAGGTTVITGNNNGLTAGGTQIVMLSPGSLVEEIVTVTVPGTGSGPYTYTVAAAGTVKNVHPIGDTVVGPTLHSMKDQTDGSFYTVEVGLGSLFGSAGTTLRFVDCKVELVKRTSKAGQLLELEVDLVGIASVVQAGTGIPLNCHPGKPCALLLHVWRLDARRINRRGCSLCREFRYPAEKQYGPCYPIRENYPGRGDLRKCRCNAHLSGHLPESSTLLPCLLRQFDVARYRCDGRPGHWRWRTHSGLYPGGWLSHDYLHLPDATLHQGDASCPESGWQTHADAGRGRGHVQPGCKPQCAYRSDWQLADRAVLSKKGTTHADERFPKWRYHPG